MPAPYTELSNDDLNDLLIKYRGNLARLLKQSADQGILATDLSIRNHIEATQAQIEAIRQALRAPARSALGTQPERDDAWLFQDSPPTATNSGMLGWG